MIYQGLEKMARKRKWKETFRFNNQSTRKRRGICLGCGKSTQSGDHSECGKSVAKQEVV